VTPLARIPLRRVRVGWFGSDAWDWTSGAVSNAFHFATHAASSFLSEVERDPLKALNDLGNAFGLTGVNLNLAVLRGRPIDEAFAADLANARASRDIAQAIEDGDTGKAAKLAWVHMRDSGDLSGPVMHLGTMPAFDDPEAAIGQAERANGLAYVALVPGAHASPSDRAG